MSKKTAANPFQALEEEAYHAFRRDDGAAWQPTDLRVSVANRPPQVVYRWGDSS